METEQPAAFCEHSNELLSLVSRMLCVMIVSHRAAVCPAHGDAGDSFASEGAWRPFPAPHRRGRQPPWHLQLLCAAIGIEKSGACACPHTQRASRPPARPFTLSIAAAAVAQRHSVVHEPAAPQAAMLVSPGQDLCACAADSTELRSAVANGWCARWERAQQAPPPAPRRRCRRAGA